MNHFLDRVSNSSGKGTLTAAKVMRRWAYQLGNGLQYLHDSGFHSNGCLVLRNLYLNEHKGDIKIGVFGMIRAFKQFRTTKNK